MSSEISKKNEDIYIAREQLERKRAKLEKEQAAMAEAEKKKLKELHHMHCPKCGSQLVEIKFREILVDTCTGCHGVWLDTGELDQVVEDSSFINSMLKIFK
ncbi:zf-TFIIB domain-containing protein [bacterium]|nr:zf-TFIIB domain-containing protein [bacterium]